MTLAVCNHAAKAITTQDTWPLVLGNVIVNEKIYHIIALARDNRAAQAAAVQEGNPFVLGEASLFKKAQ